jgi:hypothetical protein
MRALMLGFTKQELWIVCCCVDNHTKPLSSCHHLLLLFVQGTVQYNSSCLPMLSSYSSSTYLMYIVDYNPFVTLTLPILFYRAWQSVRWVLPLYRWQVPDRDWQELGCWSECEERTEMRKTEVEVASSTFDCFSLAEMCCHDGVIWRVARSRVNFNINLTCWRLGRK